MLAVRERTSTFEVFFEANLRAKKEHQQLVNMILVRGEIEHARLSRQLTHELFAFQPRLLLHTIMFTQRDRSYVKQRMLIARAHFTAPAAQSDDIFVNNE